jgi:LysM domain-containing protein
MRTDHALLRSLLGALAIAGSLSMPRLSFAQEDEETIPVEEPGPPGEAVEEGGATEGGKKGKGGPKNADNPPQVSETHQVQSGDTLWDLCSKYLNSPWYWPKIWSYNPQISNPHWIFPGNELRFYPSDENLPTNVEVSQSLTIPQEEKQGQEGIDTEDLVRTAGNQAVGHAIPTSYFSAHIGFIESTTHETAGEIVNSESEAYMLSDYDRTYVKFKSPAKKGENYAVYRVLSEIQHPVTGDPYGYSVEILGGITIVDTSPNVATGQIAQSYRPIERGDYVAKWPDKFGTRVNPVPNQAEAQGYIIESVGEIATELGEHHIVFIDKGKKDGVQTGNTFAVVTRGDNYTAETQGLPNEDIGQLMVIDVQDRASTAVVTKSIHELAVGDKVEMRRQ